MASADQAAKLAELKRLQAEVQRVEAELDAGVKEDPDENLTMFFGDGCPFTAKAAAPVSCLERHLGRRIQRVETWHSEGGWKQWESVGGKKDCGGVPFFYNRTSGESICGVADCPTLLKWAQVST